MNSSNWKEKFDLISQQIEATKQELNHEKEIKNQLIDLVVKLATQTQSLGTFILVNEISCFHNENFTRDYKQGN